MLGEQLGQETGEITGMRVLPSEGNGPRLEVSYQANGTMLGVEITDMGTYVSEVRPDGSLHGRGQGVLMAHEGDIVTWTGEGVGHVTGGAAASWRGSLYYRTTSQRLARLNGVVGMFEYDTDEAGKTNARVFEWR